MTHSHSRSLVRLGILASAFVLAVLPRPGLAEGDSKAFRIGVAGGLAWNSADVFTVSGPFILSSRANSFNPAGALSISFLENSVFGAHISFDVFSTSISGTANALIGTASGSLGFNFNAFHNRHYIGFGMCHANFWHQTDTPGAPSVYGLTIDAKDYWPQKSGPEIFLTARWHFFSSAGISDSLLLMLGVDF